jgi:hypothetical protein
MSGESNQPKLPGGMRLYFGLFFFGLSWLMPFLSIWIASTALPIAAKTLIIGLVSIGGPEIVGLIAISIMCKECFEFLLSKSFGFLKKLAPRGSVSRARYRVGLFMFVLPLLPWYVLAYAPQLIPPDGGIRLYICLASEFCFWSSLFVLGGDFWDKLRSLFIYEARVVIPQAVSSTPLHLGVPAVSESVTDKQS